MGMPDTSLSPHDFWEQIYRDRSKASSGRPSAALERFAAQNPPGTALELGSGKGDDAVWLAKRGWQVTAVDISPTALAYARENAERQGVEGRIDFQQHNLAESFPDISCDLAIAMYLQTPLDFPRIEILRHAAATVTPGGLLLIAAHGSAPPWAWKDEKTGKDHDFPTAQEQMGEMDLPASDWAEVFVGDIERKATGPEGQTAMVIDGVIALERRDSA